MWCEVEVEVEVEVGHKKKKNMGTRKNEKQRERRKENERERKTKQAKTNSKVGKMKNGSGVRREDREMRVQGGPGWWEEGDRHSPCR